MAWGTKLMAWAPLAEGKNGLFAMQDKQYAAFQAKLTPGVEQPHLAPWNAQQNHSEDHRESPHLLKPSIHHKPSCRWA